MWNLKQVATAKLKRLYHAHSEDHYIKKLCTQLNKRR